MSENDRDRQSANQSDLAKSIISMRAALNFDLSAFERMSRLSSNAHEMRDRLAKHWASLDGLRAKYDETISFPSLNKEHLDWLTKAVTNRKAEVHSHTATLLQHTRKMAWSEGTIDSLPFPMTEMPLQFEMSADLKVLLKSSFAAQITKSMLSRAEAWDAFLKVVDVPDGNTVEAKPEEAAVEEAQPEYSNPNKLKLDINTFRAVMEAIGFIVLIHQFIVLLMTSVDKITDLVEDKEGIASMPQAKLEARKAASSEWDVEALKHIRVTSGHNVRLRVSPSLSSDIIVELPQYTWLSVIDKTNRTWLEVSVKDGDEVLTGWVSRRYTKHLH